MTSAESSNAKNKNNPQGIVILGVNIHCEGCANEVGKYLRRFEGVEGVEIDGTNNKVRVKGKMVDPIKVRERLRKKMSGNHVDLISPKPSQKEENVKEVEKKKPPEAEVIEVALKINLHCESCAKEVKHCILKIEGVQTVGPNIEKNEVRVKGTMNPQKLVEFVNKKCGRHARILKQTSVASHANINGNEVNKRCGRHARPIVNNGNQENKDDACCTSHDQLSLVYAPQLFSDENPNSCSLM